MTNKRTHGVITLDFDNPGYGSPLRHLRVVKIMVVGQHGIFGGGTATQLDLSYMADTIILLRYFESQGEVRQAISVSKKRNGKHERSIREFKITSSGIHIGEPLKAFHGVRTGVPHWIGVNKNLMEGTDAAEV